jgi:hypothetical protein
MSQRGYEAAMVMETLERHFFGMVGREYDGELSQLMVALLMPLFIGDGSEADAVPLVNAFVDRRREHLQWVYQHNIDVTDDPFLLQPESIIIFELLDRDPSVLAKRWEDRLPRRFLESLAAAWGHPLPP